MLRYKYSLAETTPPAAEPLLLAEVKSHLRIDQSSDDNLLAALITSVRQICEQVSGLALINRNYSLYLDSWDSDVLFLPQPPLVSVSAVKVYAEDGSFSVYAADNYLADNKSLTPRIVLKSGAALPLPARSANGIEIQYTAGFGTAAANVPDRKSTRLNSSHSDRSRMPSSA